MLCIDDKKGGTYDIGVVLRKRIDHFHASFFSLLVSSFSPVFCIS